MKGMKSVCFKNSFLPHCILLDCRFVITNKNYIRHFTKINDKQTKSLNYESSFLVTIFSVFLNSESKSIQICLFSGHVLYIYYSYQHSTPNMLFSFSVEEKEV